MDTVEIEELEQPLIVPVSHRHYRLVQDFTYYWQSGQGVEKSITVPAGFTYDGATVPRPLWSISGLAPDGVLRAAACVHDFLYLYRDRMPRHSFEWKNPHTERWEPATTKWNRADADRLFKKMMLDYGYAKHSAEMAYRAVRLFGWIWWDYCLPVPKL